MTTQPSLSALPVHALSTVTGGNQHTPVRPSLPTGSGRKRRAHTWPTCFPWPVGPSAMPRGR